MAKVSKIGNPQERLGCCESRMAERRHWWTDKWLRSLLFLSLFLYKLSSYLSIYLSIHPSIPPSHLYMVYKLVFWKRLFCWRFSWRSKHLQPWRWSSVLFCALPHPWFGTPTAKASSLVSWLSISPSCLGHWLSGPSLKGNPEKPFVFVTKKRERKVEGGCI